MSSVASITVSRTPPTPTVTVSIKSALSPPVKPTLGAPLPSKLSTVSVNPSVTSPTTGIGSVIWLTESRVLSNKSPTTGTFIPEFRFPGCVIVPTMSPTTGICPTVSSTKFPTVSIKFPPTGKLTTPPTTSLTTGTWLTTSTAPSSKPSGKPPCKVSAKSCVTSCKPS